MQLGMFTYLCNAFWDVWITILSNYLKLIKIVHVQVTNMSLADVVNKAKERTDTQIRRKSKNRKKNNFAPIKYADVIV